MEAKETSVIFDHFSPAACNRGAVIEDRPAWVWAGAKAFAALGWTEVSSCDAGEMVFFTPS